MTPQVTPQVARVLGAVRLDCPFAELQSAAGLKDRIHILKTHLEPLLLAGWIEHNFPDKLRHSKQNFMLIDKGFKYLQKYERSRT